MTVATVRLWGTDIGAVSLDAQGGVAAFEYDPDFVAAPIDVELSPFKMPRGEAPFSFPELDRKAFHGLPGMLADSLPDKYGNAVIDAWLASQGRAPESFDAVERLCYIGTRGMGALEFAPVKGPSSGKSQTVHLDALVQLASDVLSNRAALAQSFAEGSREAALREILLIGTSAGGARAKAVIAWNPDTNEVRSGQAVAEPGFGYWLLKFDGVAGNGDKDLRDPQGYGAIEYAYSLMARAAGVAMGDTRILEENGRRHFMTRRFDREDGGGKLHMQSLAALAHLDFNQPRTHSYDQAFLAIRQLDLGMEAVEEQFRRMAFNVVGRNQDDHVKNIAFLMDRDGTWTLSPAYDITWSYNPLGDWTSKHQMSVNGKWDGFAVEDFRETGRRVSLRRGRAVAIFDEVVQAVRRWPEFAAEAGVSDFHREQVAKSLRLALPDK